MPLALVEVVLIPIALVIDALIHITLVEEVLIPLALEIYVLIHLVLVVELLMPLYLMGYLAYGGCWHAYISLRWCIFCFRCIFDIYIDIDINIHIYYAFSYHFYDDVVLFNLKCIVCMLLIYMINDFSLF